MEYTTILNALNEASAFDLYRLHVAIGNELDNPKRMLKVKQSLRIGMETTYFCFEENRLIPVRVTEIKRSKIVVQDIKNSRRGISLPYYMLNISNADTAIYETSNKLTANNLSVGDIVGFTHNGTDVVGMVQKLNQKTVSLISTTGERWRAGYSGLHRIHDSEGIREEIMQLDCKG